MAKVMPTHPEEGSPMWWREHEHDHKPNVDPKSGPPFCDLCWVELDPLTLESTDVYR